MYRRNLSYIGAGIIAAEALTIAALGHKIAKEKGELKKLETLLDDPCFKALKKAVNDPVFRANFIVYNKVNNN